MCTRYSALASTASSRKRFRRSILQPPRFSLRVMREALQAAARETLRLCRLSKPAQAGLEPQAPAPRGLSLLGAARRCACGPHVRSLRVALCPPRGLFLLGAARRGARWPPRLSLRVLRCPPRGLFRLRAACRRNWPPRSRSRVHPETVQRCSCAHLCALGHPHHRAARTRVARDFRRAWLGPSQRLEFHGLRCCERGTPVKPLARMPGDELLDDAVFERMETDHHQTASRLEHFQ